MVQSDVLEPDLFEGLALKPASPPPSAKPIASRALTAHAHAVTEDHHKGGHAFKSISEAADSLSLPQHVLRFWETKFSQIKPIKLKGGRRYYRPEDIEILSTIKHLLYKQGYTIKGAKKAFGEARKHKEPPMTAPSSKPPRRKFAPVEDTPLFQLPPIVPMPQAAPQSLNVAPIPAPRFDDRKRGELKMIQAELLQLRQLLTELPA